MPTTTSRISYLMRTTLTIDDDGVLTFPDELIEQLGWKEGDVLQWIDNKDGSFSLVKPDERV
jgi:bifunctional DNA-binding transcriptional regulator/antitoxin component of YhaV-PrlF toxin-antitoxin module